MFLYFDSARSAAPTTRRDCACRYRWRSRSCRSWPDQALVASTTMSSLTDHKYLVEATP